MNKSGLSARGVLLSAAIAALATAGQAVAADQGAASAPAAPPAPAARSSGLDEIIVTARRRDENLQSVPVAVSVVSGAALAAKGNFSPYDLQSVTTGLSVVSSTGDKVNVTYSIRGQTQTEGTLFPAVVTYFNEVPVTHFSQGDFFDLSNIQVLRGPQGVLFGRVTDGGNVMIVPQRPTNKFEGYAEVKLGNYNLHDFDGALNIPVIDDKLLIRGAFEIDRADGYTINTYNGNDLDNTHSDAFRFSVVAKPTDWLENYTVVNYQHINQNGNGSVLSAVNSAAVVNTAAAVLNLFRGAYGIAANGQVFPYQAGLTPLTPDSLAAALQGDLARQQARSPRANYNPYPTYYKLKNLFVTNSTTINLSESLTLKNIFGYTAQKFDESEDLLGENSSLFGECDSKCATAGFGIGGPNLPKSTQRQFSEEVRLAGHSFNNNLNWSVGFYADRQDPDGASEINLVDLGVLQSVILQNDHTRSTAGFVSGEYDFKDLVPGLKANAGYRYTRDSDRSQDERYFGVTYPNAALPALTAALQAGGLGALAPIVANATVYPNIPYGQCVTINSPGIFGPAICTDTSVKSHANTWTAGLSYDISRGEMVYGRASRGYRPGGVNSAALPGLPPSYAPDFDTSFEIGYKGDWRIGDVPVRTNIALYHDSYTNIQKQVIIEAANGAPSNLIENITSATIKGAEFEGTIKPTRELTLRVNYAYTDAKYKHNDTSQAGNPPGSADPCNPANFKVTGFCTDNLFAYTPRHAVTVGFDYRLPIAESAGRITFGGDLRYRSSEALMETSALNPASVVPELTTLDLNASWNNVLGNPFDLTFFMTNVTDRLYKTATADLTQNSSLGATGDYYAPPRMFGFGLKYHFGTN